MICKNQTSEIKEVMVWLACASHGSDVENKTYGEMADAMLIELDERGYDIVKKSSMAQDLKTGLWKKREDIANG